MNSGIITLKWGKERELRKRKHVILPTIKHCKLFSQELVPDICRIVKSFISGWDGEGWAHIGILWSSLFEL